MARVTEQFCPAIDYMAPEYWDEAEKQLAAFAAPLRKKGGICGEEIAFQIADGYARYLVKCERPLTLIHIDIGDGYQADPILIRGLRLKDCQAMIERSRFMAELFSGREIIHEQTT
jgi:hypothetical protein